MKKKTIIIIAVCAVLALIGLGSYNGLVSLQEQAETAWAQVENQLQRRADLVPNLVSTVKGYASHEQEVLTAVTNARARVGSAGTVNEKIAANNELGSALSRLLVVMENYPTLKADQSFLTLQSQLEGTENRIAVERNRYNEAAQKYNKTIRKIPHILFAKVLGFERRDYFEASRGAHVAPTVQF